MLACRKGETMPESTKAICCEAPSYVRGYLAFDLLRTGHYVHIGWLPLKLCQCCGEAIEDWPWWAAPLIWLLGPFWDGAICPDYDTAVPQG